MKYLIFLLGVTIFLQSCVEVRFEEPQPKGIENLDVFPEAFQGLYLLGDMDTLEVSREDIKIHNYKAPEKDNLALLEKDSYTISEQFVIRKWKKNFYINIKEKEDSVWTLLVLKSSKKETGAASLTLKEKDTEKINKLKKITKVKEIRHDDGGLAYFLVNPSRRELKKILKLFPVHDFGSIQKIEKK